MNPKLILFFSISTVAVLSLDLFGYPAKVQSLLGLSSSFIAASLFGVSFCLRLFTKKIKFSKKLINIFFSLFVILLLAGEFFTFINYSLYPNFVYSILHLNTHILIYIAVVFGSSFLLFRDKEFFIKNYAKLLIGIPIILGLIIISMMLWPLNQIYSVTGEDKIIENLQFIFLLFGSFGAFLVMKRRFIRKKISIIFILLGFLLLFIALDEISWGQRIFNFSTPEQIRIINSQNETTLHNVNYFHKIVPIGYILIGFYGALSPLLLKSKRVNSQDLKQYFVPGRKYCLIFILPAIFNTYTLFFEHNLGNLSELAELYIYSGISLFLLEKGLDKKPYLKKS